MLRVASVSLASSIVIACASRSPAPRGPHEPAGFTRVADNDMHALNNGGWGDAHEFSITHGYLSGVTDSTAPPSRPAGGQFAHPPGYAGGTPPAPEEHPHSAPT